MNKSFCSQCGHSINSNSSFCSGCGSPVAKYSEVYNQNVTTDKKAPLSFKKVAIRFIIGLTGLLLIFLALKAPIAMLLGQKVNASVTRVQRAVDSNSSSMDYNYNIHYSFTRDGKAYGGSYRMNKVYNVSKLPREGSMIVVHYLPAYPLINTRDISLGALGIQTILLLLFGVILLLASVVPGKSIFNIRVNGVM